MTKETLKRLGERMIQKLGAYKYPLLVLLLGILLLLLPSGKEKKTQVQLPEPELSETEDLEQRLELLLREIDGAGEVKVLLSVESGMENIYQTDRQQTNRGEDVERDEETVLISKDGQETPVIVKTIYPSYKGAVVVCRGADSAAVRLSIVRAVSSLTGLGSDKITVIKMKG